MSQSNWLSFALDIAEGINHLHSKEILHNDIKTDNVLVSRRKAVIVDLGKACFLKDAPAKKYAVKLKSHIAMLFKLCTSRFFSPVID
jgi:serine/threonine protein kinase